MSNEPSPRWQAAMADATRIDTTQLPKHSIDYGKFQYLVLPDGREVCISGFIMAGWGLYERPDGTLVWIEEAPND